jgi:hypothetical protein
MQERFEAAMWCLIRFDQATVDLFGTKQVIGRYSTETVYGFYFAREKDVTMFRLAWG